MGQISIDSEKCSQYTLQNKLSVYRFVFLFQILLCRLSKGVADLVLIKPVLQFLLLSLRFSHLTQNLQNYNTYSANKSFLKILKSNLTSFVQIPEIPQFSILIYFFSTNMSNLSTEHLIKCITEKDKYKNTQQYLKEVELDNQDVYNFINQALYNIITTNHYTPSSKLYALRFFKDIIVSAQFHLIDGLNQNIMKQIIKASQFDKENIDKNKRGSLYFEQVQKRKKQADTEKVSFSYVLFSTQIVYVLGVWHATDENNQTSDYAVIYERLKKAKVPFPQNDKQLKFFKPDEKDLFMKNYKQWLDKLPEIEEESEEVDDKENIKSKKSIKSKQKIPQPPEEPKEKNFSQAPLITKDQNKNLQKTQSQIETEETQNSKVYKPVIDEAQFKKLVQMNKGKDVQIAKMNQKIDSLSQKTKEYEEKIQEQQVALRNVKESNSAQSKTEEQKSKIRMTALENKYSLLENKHVILQKQTVHLKSKLQESESIKSKQNSEIQHLQQNLKKVQIEKAQSQEKLRVQASELKERLKEYQEKIIRLEREIEQLNTIKKSYKNIMGDPHQEENERKDQTNGKQQKIKIESLQKQIAQSSRQHKKEITHLNNQIKQLKKTNEEHENTIKSKDSEIHNLEGQIKVKAKEIAELQINYQNIKTEASKLANQGFAIKQHQTCELQKNATLNEQAVPIHLGYGGNTVIGEDEKKRQNSMSDYLHSQAVVSKYEPSQPQRIKYPTQVESYQVQLTQKIKNKSLGKTEKSEEKLRQKKERYSAGKTFHFTNSDQRTIHESFQMNSNRLSQVNCAIKRVESTPYFNMWKPVSRGDAYTKVDHQQSFCKKTSALYLERKPYFFDYETPKSNAIQTMVPYIDNYFSQKSNMSYQDFVIFKSLCLSPLVRQKQPIFVDNNIQVKLLPNMSGSKQVFVIQVMNTGYSSIKLKAVSCHDQFKIVGEKSRFLHSNSTVQYRIQARNKDLNLRYPIVSLIFIQEEGCRTKSIAYNVPLPLTLFEFTEMRREIPNFYEHEGSKLKVFRSETFTLNPRLDSLKSVFTNLSFTQKVKQSRMESKQVQLSWEGNLMHSFIQNVDTYYKMCQSGNQVTIQFAVRDYDIISENYAKAMLQALMFLLQ